ncbi:MAG TPA: energy transducer TonB [Luteibacter sp.]|jgi:protein TonB|nr:energy transducer TonB [Luteibacter sp.]
MDTRNISQARHSVRGAARPAVLGVVIIVALLALAAWFLIIKPHQDAMQVASGDTAAAANAAKAKAAAPANVEALSVEQLLTEARTAMNEQRLLAPAGNNAFEFYLKALEKQPGNTVAADALRETFPFGATSAEQEINQRDFNEAQREIDLLAKADPENYTLTILRSKLDAQRKTLDREQQQALDQQQKAQLAQQQSAAAKVQADQQAIEQQRLAAQQAQAARVAQQQQATAAITAPKPVAKVAEASNNDAAINDAILTKKVPPRYPTAALRANQEGWVDVEFTVDGGGKVGGVNIVDSQPKHVFDRAAIDAVSRWEFQPATRNGEAMPVTMRRRILFQLGR